MSMRNVKQQRWFLRERASRGVLLQHIGTGATIIANKVPGVRAALCVDT